jgi:hypothetical protein
VPSAQVRPRPQRGGPKCRPGTLRDIKGYPAGIENWVVQFLVPACCCGIAVTALRTCPLSVAEQQDSYLFGATAQTPTCSAYGAIMARNITDAISTRRMRRIARLAVRARSDREKTCPLNVEKSLGFSLPCARPTNGIGVLKALHVAFEDVVDGQVQVPCSHRQDAKRVLAHHGQGRESETKAVMQADYSPRKRRVCPSELAGDVA